MLAEHSLAIVIACLAILSIASYKTKALDRKGVILANIFGLLAFGFGEQTAIGGFGAFATIVVLFVLGEIVTSIGVEHKKAHPPRTIGNIVGNSGSAIIFLVLAQPVAFFASVSSAIADTFSSEIGMTSRKKPRLITTFEEVAKGTDGAITRRGTAFSIFGAAIIAAVALFFLQNAVLAIIVLVAGFAGAAIDSVLGAMLERTGLLNNTLVNFFSCLAAGIMALGIASQV